MSLAPGATIFAFVVAVMMIQPAGAVGVAVAQAPVLIRNTLRPERARLLRAARWPMAQPCRRFRGASARVRLDSARDDPLSYPNAHTAVRRIEYRDATNRVVGVTPQIGLASSWSADSLTDSIRIGFSNGYTGSVFVFALPIAARSDTVFGRAYQFQDAGPPYYAALGAAFGVRYPCAQ